MMPRLKRLALFVANHAGYRVTNAFVFWLRELLQCFGPERPFRIRNGQRVIELPGFPPTFASLVNRVGTNVNHDRVSLHLW